MPDAIPRYRPPVDSTVVEIRTGGREAVVDLGGEIDGFLRSVGARIAVVSVGRVNEYGHPSDETLQRLAGGGATVYRTDRDGDVTIETDGSAIELHTAEGRRQSLQVEGPRR